MIDILLYLKNFDFHKKILEYDINTGKYKEINLDSLPQNFKKRDDGVYWEFKNQEDIILGVYKSKTGPIFFLIRKSPKVTEERFPVYDPRFKIEYEELKEIGMKRDEPENHRFKIYWNNELKLDITYKITYPPPLSWPDLDLYNFPMWFAYLAKTERFYNLYKT